MLAVVLSDCLEFAGVKNPADSSQFLKYDPDRVWELIWEVWDVQILSASQL